MNLSLLYNESGPDAGPDDLDTLDQVREIGKTLQELGHSPEELAVPDSAAAFRQLLRERRDHLFFNLTDPVSGEGRFIAQPVLTMEREGCSYTGCPADALYLTSNKLLAKKLMKLAGVPTPRLSDNDFVPGRYIIKSVWEHGSAGMTPDSVFFAGARKEAEARMSREPRGVFAEAFLPGREINIGLLSDGMGGWEILQPSEILYTDGGNASPFLDYSSKWEEGSASFRSSVRSLETIENDEPLLIELGEIAIRCTALFGLNGYARVDFRLDEEGRPMVMEVNANPCLTPGAGFAAAAEKGGISYMEMISRIVAAPAGGN